MSGLSEIERGKTGAGMVHLYTGDGKGKTTAAAGLAVRALGAGRDVIFCQFLKGRHTCELDGLEKLGAKIIRAECGAKFIFEMNESEREELKRNHIICFDKIFLRAMDFDGVLVLDEVVGAVNAGLIEEKRLLGLINGRSSGLELVLTGRDPSDALIGAADYHTDFVMRKHPYNDGIPARRGIEY